MRFLLSRRWLLFGVVVVLLTYLAYVLGVWQFHRLDDRRADNRVLESNLGTEPAPVEDALSTDRGPTHDQEWLPVSATGTWDDARTVVVKYQTRDGEAGVRVVTPVVLEDGDAVLVNRGWLDAPNTGGSTPDTPPVSGEVSLTGYVRADATGSAARVTDAETRAVSSAEIADTVPYPLLRGWLELGEATPAPAQALAPVSLPDADSEGPHFFYGLQWWFFGALAVFGFCYLAWDERRGGDRREALQQRRDQAVSRRTQRARDAEHLAAWRYGERSDRPVDHHPG